MNSLPRKSAAFLPLQNLPVGFFPGKSTPLWGKSALTRESLRWLLLPRSTSESPNTKRAGASSAAAENMNKYEKTMKKQVRGRPILLEDLLSLSLPSISDCWSDEELVGFLKKPKRSLEFLLFIYFFLEGVDMSDVMEQTLQSLSLYT